MQLTNHAQKRWRERFPDLDPEREWYAAKKCGKNTKRKIREVCVGHAKLMRGFQGFWYALSPNRVVFVLDKDQNVVTVFPFQE